MTDPRLQAVADAIEEFIRDRHAANDGRTWTPEQAEAWMRLCVAHDAVAQADRLLAGQPA